MTSTHQIVEFHLGKSLDARRNPMERILANGRPEGDFITGSFRNPTVYRQLHQKTEQ
jgi:hypothetical protein